ncbi:YgjV family protein [Ferrimonas lipolytica]|uniref:YgjV family protein n=1 Tax=Ferrimonas lipolytica TaxID=2724191 RepID=A0A6H1UIR9_9GAMM|nr:YgjV family protein [Ferrimonas lipolytica]QIZ78924.1 YgjV family protein [Ferrimonas lipolytica]
MPVEFNLIEFVGYAASLFVAISLMMKNIVKLRWINMTGCILFVIYGASIGAWPVALMNGFCVGINVFYLIKMGREQSQQPA